MTKLNFRIKIFLFTITFTIALLFNGNDTTNNDLTRATRQQRRTGAFFIAANIIRDKNNDNIHGDDVDRNHDDDDDDIEKHNHNIPGIEEVGGNGDAFKYIESENEKSSAEKIDQFLEDIRKDDNAYANSHVSDKDLPKFGEPLQNLTVPIGRDALLQCVVDNLQTYKIAWLRVDTQTILTIQNHVITKNHRMSITHAEKRAWILKIREVKETDKGWYMCQINTDPMKNQVGYLDVVVPPDILDYPSSSDMVVREGSNITLKCAATGSPMPTITWRREDGSTIPLTELNGVRNVNSFNGSTLIIAKVNRLNMGAYLCIATNGVPPSVSKRIMLIVHFPPMIWIQNQLVGAAVGQTITLECQSEAFPKSINYWMKNDTIIVPGDKFIPKMYERVYKVIMQLTIVNADETDFVTYKCLAKNSLGDTDGAIKLYNIPKMTTTTSTTAEPIKSTRSPRDKLFSSSSRVDSTKDDFLLEYGSNDGSSSNRRRNRMKNRTKHKSYTILDELTFSSTDDLENFQQISNLWNSRDETFYRSDDPTNSTFSHQHNNMNGAASYGDQNRLANGNKRNFYQSSLSLSSSSMSSTSLISMLLVMASSVLTSTLSHFTLWLPQLPTNPISLQCVHRFLLLLHCHRNNDWVRWHSITSRIKLLL